LKRAGDECDQAIVMLLGKGVDAARLKTINGALLQLEREWIDMDGMPYGSWYRSLYASSDPYSGYASWMLPALQYAVSNKSENIDTWMAKYVATAKRLTDKINQLAASTAK